MSRDNLELQTVFGKNSCEESSVCQTISCTDITIRLLFCVVIVRHIHLHAYPLTLLCENWALLQAGQGLGKGWAGPQALVGSRTGAGHILVGSRTRGWARAGHILLLGSQALVGSRTESWARAGALATRRGPRCNKRESLALASPVLAVAKLVRPTKLVRPCASLQPFFVELPCALSSCVLYGLGCLLLF